MAYKTIQTKADEKSRQNKRLLKRNQTKLEFKLRRKREYSYNCTSTGYQEDTVRPMSAFYPPIYPIVNEWIPIQCPILPLPPIPIIINPIPPLPSPIFPYYPPIAGPPFPSIPPGPAIPSGPIIPPVPSIPNLPSTNIIISPSPSSNYSFETSFYTDLDSSAETSQELTYLCHDPLELYLNLPKDLFPSPKMLALNPNAIIDEFCKEADVENHAAWILDLEFGIPKCPITRPIPIYNVKFNSINCKNTPEAIHPGFESCHQDFKKILMFYYDCIISSWYRGYVLFNSDKSVENFQSWLSIAMQEFGMCWP